MTTPSHTPSTDKNRANWLFVDLNSYFASVEHETRPELRGQPIGIVPIEAKTACVIACSYQAKVYGIRTGTSACFSTPIICSTLNRLFLIQILLPLGSDLVEDYHFIWYRNTRAHHADRDGRFTFSRYLFAMPSFGLPDPNPQSIPPRKSTVQAITSGRL
jgi:nucleotidyltransferase/DNA polymerase involved in DNA repair